MTGICSYGGYVPRYRLNRGTIAEAIAWMNMAIMAHMQGEKAVANFDEDPITMAVAAGIDALKGVDRSTIDGVYFASTTMPYKERLNAMPEPYRSLLNSLISRSNLKSVNEQLLLPRCRSLR